MEFCIATVAFWESRGFDCTNWRKSVDGTKAMVHIGHARILVPDVRENLQVQIYVSPSPEFAELLGSSEWQEEVEEVW